jgi:hypothetical protein
MLCPISGVFLLGSVDLGGIGVKTLTLRFDLDDASIHPMHAFVAERPEYGPTRLLQWNSQSGESTVLLFYVDGPVDPFRGELESVTAASVVETSTNGGQEGFYLFVREELDRGPRDLIGAYAGEDVVVVPPVVHDVDGTIQLTVVGSSAAVGRTLERLPDGVDVSVSRVRSGAVDVGPLGAGLTDRQREALANAVAAGYYEEPRTATVSDVADALDCAPSTAAEHLRRAEARLVRRSVAGLASRGRRTTGGR